jgi:uncharacterized membrane protein YdcZ (DUF606 family)
MFHRVGKMRLFIVERGQLVAGALLDGFGIFVFKSPF